MTMASSTTKPTEMVSAIKERLSRPKPTSHIKATVPARASGRVTPAVRVGTPRRRKRKTTSMTRPMLAARVSWRSSTLARMVSVRSATISMSMAAGIQRLSSGRSAFTRSTVATTLASVCRWTKIRTAGRWLNQPARRLSREPASTLATSARWTTEPVTVLMTRGR